MTTCGNCLETVTFDDVLDPAYECRRGHYFTRPEAGDTNICPECSIAGRKIGIACPACRELLPEAFVKAEQAHRITHPNNEAVILDTKRAQIL